METILSLPLEKKIGQLFFIGIPGPNFDGLTGELVGEISPGGVCLFTRNIREATATRELLDSLRSAMAVEPLLSLDQEGGLVDRLRRIAEPMPAAASLRDSEDARELALLTAELTRMLGFNMNFAPVVDVVTPERERSNNGLYSRAFGNDAASATELSGEYLDELQAGGVLGCVKHFPGLGAIQVDSHEELPTVDLSFDELSETDLAPYRTHFTKGRAHAVMVGHAAFPNLDLQERDADGKLLPSSLSFNFVSKLLRATMGFKGLVVTDDLEMGAILRNYGIGKAAVMAFAAGADMLAICNRPDNIRTAFRAVLDAVRDGAITEDRIDASLQRIAAIKNLTAPTPVFEAARLERISERIGELKKRL